MILCFVTLVCLERCADWQRELGVCIGYVEER